MSSRQLPSFLVKIYIATSVRYSPEEGVEFATECPWQFTCNEATTFATTKEVIRNEWNVSYPELAGCPLQIQCRVNIGIGQLPNYFILMTIGDETSWRLVTRMARRRQPYILDLVVTPLTTIPDNDHDEFFPRESMVPFF
jgi:hypothetical protein